MNAQLDNTSTNDKHLVEEDIVPDEGVIVNYQPVIFIAPDPPVRRSARIRDRSSSVDPSPQVKGAPKSAKPNYIENHCTRRHKG